MKKDLTRANKLMSDLCTKDKHLTPITTKDFTLFESFFKKERHTYGNSWTYVTQGIYGIGPENLGYKYYDGKNLSAVYIYPKIEQPETQVFYWVRPMGDNILSIINTFAHSLFQKEHIPTYIKKIFPEQFEFLRKKGFSDTSKFPWHSSCTSEDDTYPEIILDVSSTLFLSKKAKRNTKLHRAYQYFRHYQNEKTLIVDNVKNRTKQVKKVLDEFFSRIKIYNKNNISHKTDYYNIIRFDNAEKMSFQKIIQVKEQFAGFYFAVKQDADNASLYATITLREVSNHLTEYIYYFLMNQLSKDNISFLNLGGSETKQLHDFKCKFIPLRQNIMHWATLS